MPVMPPMIRPKGAPSREEVQRDYDKRRGSARHRGYDARWDGASRRFRREHPLCAYCEIEGKVRASEVVDHLYPQRVYRRVFWLKKWWVASCRLCHDGMKAKLEGRGKAAIDALALRLGREVLDEREHPPIK